MIPQSFIQELLARADIVEVVGRAVQLKKAGANFLGLCPFHGEKSPSFTVSPAKQFYHCFGCGVHGSAIGFVMEQQGLSYVEAIEQLAQNMGLTVPREYNEKSANEQRQAPGLLQVLATAEEFYRKRLRDAPLAIEYLKRRGLSGETAKRYGIGYAADAWRNLEAAFADYEQEELVTAGLVIQSDQNKRYDRFRERVMFPIRNPRGQVIGFGGRIIGDGEPKYLNSPETPLFVKGRELYGLFEGREAIRRANAVLVVEGYMDVVMLAQHGVELAVATLGTATTEQHLQKLQRLVDRVVFCFDGDKAGRKAAWRALEVALPMSNDAKRYEFLFLPAEHDPDSFVREYGREAFEQCMAEALPLSRVLIEGLTRELDLASVEDRAQLQSDAKPLMQRMPPTALRDQLLREIARLAGTELRALEHYCQLDQNTAPLTKTDAHRTEFGSPIQVGRKAAASVMRRSSKSAPMSSSRRVVMLLAVHPMLAQRIDAPMLAWLDPQSKAWIEKIAALPAGTNFAGVMESLGQHDPQMASELIGTDTDLVAEMSAEEAEHELQGAIRSLAEQAVRRDADAILLGISLSPRIVPSMTN